MKKICALSMICCLLGASLLGGCGGLNQPKELTKGADSVVICTEGSKAGEVSVADFSYNLFARNLTETNPIMSPVSAYFAMSMVGAGAEGETLKEFQSVFGDNMIDESGELMDSLAEDKENIVVNIANSAWVDNNLQAEDAWLSIVSSYYKGEVYQTELMGAMGDINRWAEEKTEGLIKAILDEPLTAEARLAVLNAIYFNADWQTPFEPESTTIDIFTKEDGTTVDVDMMRAYSGYYDYFAEEGFDGVVLPYVDSDYAFVAMKPTDGQTVRQMYEGLSMNQVEQLVSGAENRLMNLKLPKFEVEYDKLLNNDFIDMGVVSAFDGDSADFSGIGTSDDGYPLYISMVRQKAVIKVDEEGTEAAAVTAVVMECGSAMPVEEPIDVFFDKPFFYMIYDTETNVPLFMGIFDGPDSTVEVEPVID